MDHEQPPTTQNETSPLIIPNPPENPNPVSVLPMVKCFCVGPNQPTQRLNLHVSSVSPLPKSYRDAFHDSNWQNAMRDEYNALITKLGLFRYKARLVANGSTQLEGVDVDETFSPVFKPGTIQTVLSLAASRHWPIHYMVIYLRQFICIILQGFGTLYILIIHGMDTDDIK
ncbi:ribonuclease H-like domain-containing protein [Tanacetum coccineum]